ncbi:hypothetical protein AAE478_006516 [Parahypoxylon ruwenzoriense]
MDSGSYILQQCQFEACESTILLGGPYCAFHTRRRGFSKLATGTPPGPTPAQRQSGSHRPPQSSTQQMQQLNGNPTTMASPEEKLGDAITVKPPLTMPGPPSGKKQLPDKHVARKTTSSATSKPMHNLAATRAPDSKQSTNPGLAMDDTFSSPRPSKKPRLSTSADKELEAHHLLSSYVESSFRAPSRAKPTKTEECDPRCAAPSDFALRPKKGTPGPLEMPPRPKSRDHRAASTREHQYGSLLRGQPYNNAKGQGFPSPPFIDLTGDDLPPHTSNDTRHHEHLRANARKGHADLSAESRTPPKDVTPEPQHDRKLMEVQVDAKQTQTAVGHFSVSLPKTSTGHVDASSGSERNHVHNASFGSAPHPYPKRHNDVKTPLLTETTPTPSHSQTLSPVSQPMGAEGKQTTAQYPQPPVQASTDVALHNGQQDRRSSPIPNLAEVVKINHTANSCRETSDSSSSTIRLTTNGIPKELHSAEINSPSISNQKAREAISEVIEIPNPIAASKVNGTSIEHQGASLDTPLPGPQTPERGRKIPTNGLQATQRLILPKVRAALEPRPTEFDINSTQSLRLPENVITQPAIHTSQGAGNGNGKEQTSASDVVSMAQGRSWRNLNPEERRQAWIANHDPDKFDSYIYGKLNEPNRPGSALYNTPEYQQPPRPTRPATRFAYIDPRVHWTHPHSKKWHLRKQEEIRERGTKKSNFGKAAARAAQRRQEEGDDPPRVGLPERVRSNPKWLAALDELDEMAEKYHARNRMEREGHRKETQRKGKEK